MRYSRENIVMETNTCISKISLMHIQITGIISFCIKTD